MRTKTIIFILILFLSNCAKKEDKNYWWLLGLVNTGTNATSTTSTPTATPIPITYFTKLLETGSGRAIYVDSSANTYIAGEATGAVTSSNTKTGTYDAYVAKYDSKGILQWAKQYGVASNLTWANGVSADSDGNVYVAGRTKGNLDGETLTGTEDAFLMKFDSAGNKQWTKLSGVASAVTQFNRGIYVDTTDNSIYVSGTTRGNLDGQTLTGVQDVVLIKYKSDGTKEWTKLYGKATGTVNAADMVKHGTNFYTVGEVNKGIDSNAQIGSYDASLIKIDSSGTKQWSRTLGVAGKITISIGVSTDSNENIYVTGYTLGDLDGNTLIGTDDAFLTKYDSSGNKQWTKLIGVAGKGTKAYTVGTDSSSNVYISGQTCGDLNGVTRVGTCDVMVAKYDSSGTHIETKLNGVATKTSISYDIYIDSRNALHLAGQTVSGYDGETVTGSSAILVSNKIFQ